MTEPQTSAKGEGPSKRPPRELLSIRAYAARRAGLGLHGGTHSAVRRAIADGRIEKALVVISSGRVRIDPQIADQEWAERTDPVKSRGPGVAKGPSQSGLFGEMEMPRTRDSVGSSSTEVRIREAHADLLIYKAKLAELVYHQKASALVRTSRVNQEMFLVSRDVLDQIRGLADKLSPVLAAETDPHRVRTILLGGIDAALRALATQLEASAPPPAVPGPGHRPKKRKVGGGAA